MDHLLIKELIPVLQIQLILASNSKQLGILNEIHITGFLF